MQSLSPTFNYSWAELRAVIMNFYLYHEKRTDSAKQQLQVRFYLGRDCCTTLYHGGWLQKANRLEYKLKFCSLQGMLFSVKVLSALIKADPLYLWTTNSPLLWIQNSRWCSATRLDLIKSELTTAKLQNSSLLGVQKFVGSNSPKKTALELALHTVGSKGNPYLSFIARLSANAASLNSASSGPGARLFI